MQSPYQNNDSKETEKTFKTKKKKLAEFQKENIPECLFVEKKMSLTELGLIWKTATISRFIYFLFFQFMYHITTFSVYFIVSLYKKLDIIKILSNHIREQAYANLFCIFDIFHYFYELNKLKRILNSILFFLTFKDFFLNLLEMFNCI